MNINTIIEDKTYDKLKMLCAAASKNIKDVIDEVILLGIDEYIKKYGNGGKKNGKN